MKNGTYKFTKILRKIKIYAVRNKQSKKSSIEFQKYEITFETYKNEV